MDFTEVLQTRRSIRKYLETPVKDEVIKRILQAAQLSPTWAHKQGQRVIVVRDPAVCNQLKDTIGQKWTETVPIFLVVCIEPEQSGIAPNKMEYYPVDAAIVMQSMILAATNEGLGTCWIGLFDEPEVRRVLSIPESYRVIGITPLGYPASQPQPKERKKLEDICFDNAFGNRFTV